MQTFIARFLLFLIIFTLAVPESYAKRVGGGRSAGRQSQVMRQQTAPAAQRQQPAAPAAATPQPGLARQAPPPVAPAPQIRRQASSPWGGMLGGALLGLGLGSLMSSGDSHADTANADAANQSSGSSSEGGTAAGMGDSQVSAAQSSPPPQENSLGSVLWLGVIALLVYFLIRRTRTRSRRHYPKRRL